MATANELSSRCTRWPSRCRPSFDLREVVDSTRDRLRSVVRFSALVVLVRDDGAVRVDVELAEGVRLPAHLNDHDLPSRCSERSPAAPC